MMLALLISLLLVIPGLTSSVIPGSTGNLEMADQVGHDEETVDVAEIIFEHIGDDYEWHIFTWGDKHVVLHLPVIVHSSTGWHIFSSKRLEHGESYEGLKIDPEKGKIVEVDSGNRPFDISITKNVLSLMMSSVLLLVIILLTARWYKKHDVLEEAPTGIAALMEPLVIRHKAENRQGNTSKCRADAARTSPGMHPTYQKHSACSRNSYQGGRQYP